MIIELKELSEECGIKEYEMMQGIEKVENGFSNQAYGLSYEEFLIWIKLQIDYSKGIGLPQNYVPCTTYVLYVDDVPVGYGRVRHETNNYLENVIGAGPIGYGISKDYRGKGFGKILFSKLIEECKIFGYKTIKQFPKKDNLATIKIMQKCGGQIIGDLNDEKVIVEFKNL